jgi:hypothetical protein
MLAIADKSQEQSPRIAIGQNRVTREVSLLAQPFVEERVQQLGEGSRLHDDLSVLRRTCPACCLKRSLAIWTSSGVTLR